MSKVIPQLLWFCIATLCDWLKNLAPLPRPIRSKTKTNRDLLARVFPALGTGDMYLLRALIGSNDCLRLLWLVTVITLVLILRHSNENCSIVTVFKGSYEPTREYETTFLSPRRFAPSIPHPLRTTPHTPLPPIPSPWVSKVTITYRGNNVHNWSKFAYFSPFAVTCSTVRELKSNVQDCTQRGPRYSMTGFTKCPHP